MKILVLLAATILAIPATSSAGNRRCYSGGYGGGRVVYSGARYSSCYAPAVRYSNCYRPYSSYYRPSYYGGYSSYYGALPAISFTYASSSPRYYRTAPVYAANGTSLEASVQRALKRQGYYRGGIDGDIGPASRSAIRDYQDAHGLEPTGRIDSTLLRSLGV